MTSITWHASYLSHIIFVVISIYSVRLADKTIDRLIHFTVCADSTATIIVLVLYTHVIRRLTNGITVMCITSSFVVDLGYMASPIQLSLPA